jgi:hypothetical protein
MVWEKYLERLAILMLCLASAAISTVPAQEVEQSLKQQFEGKILVLRHSLQGNSQEYGSDGAVLKAALKARGRFTAESRLMRSNSTLTASCSKVIASTTNTTLRWACWHLLSTKPGCR